MQTFETQGRPWEEEVWTEKKPRFLCAVGGAVWGGFLGIFSGALAGAAYGVWVGDVSLGLDGAILAGSGFALVGGVLGLVLHWKSE